MRKELATAQQQVEVLTQRTNDNVLIAYNVSEAASIRAPAQLTVHMRTMLRSAVSSDQPSCPGFDQVIASRMGRPRTDGKPRPVMLRLPSVATRFAIWQISKRLRSKGVRIDEFLTQQQQQQRVETDPDFAALKQQGLHPFRRGGKLMYVKQGKLLSCKKGEAALPPPPPSSTAHAQPQQGSSSRVHSTPRRARAQPAAAGPQRQRSPAANRPARPATVATASPAGRGSDASGSAPMETASSPAASAPVVPARRPGGSDSPTYAAAVASADAFTAGPQ